MGVKRTVARAAWGVARQRVGAAAVADRGRVLRRMRVDADWRRTDDFGAARLSPRDTIAVARPGRWQRHDPLLVVEAWRRPARSAALAVWVVVIAVAWWRGATRGTGPLAGVQRLPELGTTSWTR